MEDANQSDISKLPEEDMVNRPSMGTRGEEAPQSTRGMICAPQRDQPLRPQKANEKAKKITKIEAQRPDAAQYCMLVGS